MIEIKKANKNRILKAEKAGMFSAKEYLQMYSELRLIYSLLEKAINKIDSMEKVNKSDKSFIQNIEDELQNLL